MTIYIHRPTEREKARMIREGHGPCANAAHGPNPPDVSFAQNPAAFDALMRKGFFVCGRCFETYFNGRHPRVVYLEGQRLPVFRRGRG